MKIYFYGNIHSTPQLQRRFASIISILENNNIEIFSNIKTQQTATQAMEKLGDTGETLMEKINALIIEGTNQSFESTHLIALALAHKKPILYLVEKDRYIDKNLLKLKDEPKAKKLFSQEFYLDTNLNQMLLRFIERTQKEKFFPPDTPSIKFTLRITSSIEKYLKWKTHNTNKSKADFLREEIEELMEKDEEYKKFMEEK